MYLSPLGGIGKTNKAHVQEIRIQNSGIKIKISKSFYFSFENMLKYIQSYKICRSQRIFSGRDVLSRPGRKNAAEYGLVKTKGFKDKAAHAFPP